MGDILQTAIDNPRKLVLAAVAGGVALGVIGGASVNTSMLPGPATPFRWAENWTPPVQSQQFAAPVPLELDVPDDFQLATAGIADDPEAAGPVAAGPSDPRWTSLRLAQVRVEVPARLPDPEIPDAGAVFDEAAAALPQAGEPDEAGDAGDWPT